MLKLRAVYFDRGSIRFQLFRLVAAVAATVMLISLAGGALFEWGNQEKQLRQSLTTMAEAVGVAASAAVVFHDSKAAGEAFSILIARKEVEAAAVYPLYGNRLASYGDQASLPDTNDALQEHLPDFSLFSPSTTLFQPIRLDDATIGHIFIRASLRDYRNSFLWQAVLAVGVNLLGLLLVLGFGLRFIERMESALQERTEALSAANRELLAAKDAAEAATEAKSRFLAAASHDLRQPIQAINLFKDALNQTTLNEEQQRISDFLSMAAHSLLELLNDLLDVMKFDAGAIQPAREKVDIDDLFGRIDADFSPLAMAKSLRFKLHFPFGGMALCTDGKLLQSLLRNLIGNAIKYTEQGGVLVAVRRRGNRAVVQVWDTGIGIAPEHMATIFEEYFQVANPERDKAKGLGLGLAIVKRLARLLDTEIVCRSRLGRGSVFEFELPLAD
ncbi:MAG: ATP-binding protein [Rhodocyclaceae bacterium]|nr:ATP-binding protein [Rhodocyclaceae bacterium]